MIRTAASGRPRIAILTSGHGTHQRRPKTFIRHEPEDGTGAYYTINKQWPSVPKPVQDGELFRISDLLLDLDDLDSKHVRPFTEKDEVELKHKWQANSKAPERLRTRLEEMENQLSHSRRKIFELSSQPTNVWRVTNHDIISVALRGGPSQTPQIESNGEGHHGHAGALMASEVLDPRREPDILHSVCLENGISTYATKNDKLLLQWLKSRQRIAQPGPERNEAPSSPRQFTVALEQQNSIASIRRLVSQCLSTGLNATLFQTQPSQGSDKPQTSLSYQIRKACVNILDQLQPRDASAFSTLAFLGNLQQRLAPQSQNIGGPLCGFALLLSARIGNLDAVLEYMALGLKHNLWDETPEALHDILDTMNMLSEYLVMTVSNEPFLCVSDRQMLLGLLTGVDMGDGGKNAWTVSFRALVLFFNENCSGEEGHLAAGLLRAYILTLGRLGAVATLWKEWKLMGAELENQAHERKILQSRHDPDVEDAFMAAIGAALSVVAQREAAVPTDLALVDCAMLDLESIEMQDPKTWCESRRDGGWIEGSTNGEILAALDGPLDGWLAEVCLITGPSTGHRILSVGDMGAA